MATKRKPLNRVEFKIEAELFDYGISVEKLHGYWTSHWKTKIREVFTDMFSNIISIDVTFRRQPVRR